jgi:hypothetical protein
VITLNLNRKTITLSDQEQGLATGAHARSALAPEFHAAIALRTTHSTGQLVISEPALHRMIVKYSEQSVFQPLREIRHWFTYTSGAYLAPGYPPLYYNRDKNKNVSPNTSAVAAVGEGIAGFLAQRLFRCRKLARPNHDYPDIVMEGNGKTYLVEAKATLSENYMDIECIIDQELPRLASLTSSARQLDVREVSALLVGTQLISEVEYNCYLVEILLV